MTRPSHIAARTVDPVPNGPAAQQRAVARVINNSRLRRRQHINSAIVTMAGIVGVVCAAWLVLAGQPVSNAALGLFVLFFLAVGFGVTVGFHRHLTHRSFKAVPSVRATLAILGSMAAQGPPVFWVALHRMHHELSDREGDPHSPNMFGDSLWQRTRGLIHGYIGWTIRHEVPNANYYARDLLMDPLIAWVNRNYYFWIVAGFVLPAAIGGLATRSWFGAYECFLWGGLIRMFAVHNMIWWITSFAHVLGTREFTTKDLSTNNIWIALPTLGEGWHNNHHCFPNSAVLNFQWWQFDLSGLVIRSLERLGLAWDVNVPSRTLLAARLSEASALKDPCASRGNDR
jgi:stearoyl-CoA desaturase (delta-9 desaturase)